MRYFVFILALLTFACNQSPKPASERTSSVGVTTAFDELEISGEFQDMTLAVNGVSIFDPLESSEGLSEEEKADAVFQFLSEEFTVWNANLGQEAGSYLFGYGYGLCGVESTVICALWKEVGLEARTVAWDRHTMAEVRVDGHWQIFDAQHRIKLLRAKQNAHILCPITDQT